MDSYWAYITKFALLIGLYVIDRIYIGALDWLWRHVLALLSRKPTITINAVSAKYYRRNYRDNFDDNGKYIDTEYDFFQPWEVTAHNKPYDEYMFLKIDVNNETRKLVELEDVKAEIHNPPDSNFGIKVWPASKTQYRLAKNHFLEHKLPESITVQNLFELPMELTSGNNFYKYLCIQILNWPEDIAGVQLRIEMSEGKGSNIRTYLSTLIVDKEGDKLFIRPYHNKYWKPLEYDNNGNIKWSN